MSKDKKNKLNNELLDDKQKLQLQNIVNKMIKLAADTAEEYKEVDLSELQALSGSITQIHEDSPFLNDTFKGEDWKRVLSHVPTKPTIIEDVEEEEDDPDNDVD